MNNHFSLEQLKKTILNYLKHSDGIERKELERLFGHEIGFLEVGRKGYVYVHTTDGVIVFHYLLDYISSEYDILPIIEGSFHKVTPYEITLCRMKINECREQLKSHQKRFSSLQEKHFKDDIAYSISKLEHEVAKWEKFLEQSKMDIQKRKAQ